MSLAVIYEGQRKVIKIPSPNTLVQTLLAETAAQFNVAVNRVAFRHKRTILENAQPIRFANLSNNAQVDLITISTSNSQSSKNASCKIALAIEGAENTTETFDASISLLEMLHQLISGNKVPADVLNRNPEVVYLRAKYSGTDALSSTTFTSLGLAGQSARLQLRFSAPVIPPPPTNTAYYSANSTNTSTTSTANTVAEENSSAMEVVVDEPAHTVPTLSTQSTPPTITALHTPVDMDQLSTTSIRTTNSDSTLRTASPIPPYPTNTTTASITDTTNTTNTTTNTGTINSTPDVTLNIPTTTTSVNSTVPTTNTTTVSTTTNTTTTLPHPRIPAQNLLADNFDRVSIPAVLTLSKYILNILLNPTELKYRCINTENKVFTNKVAVARGAKEFLYSVGFVLEDSGYVLRSDNTTTTATTSTSASSSDSSATDSTTLSSAQLARLSVAYTALLTCMTELEIPIEEQPYNGASIQTILSAQEKHNREVQQRGAEAVVQFDPFKSHIVRTAPQPVRQKEAVSDGAAVTTKGPTAAPALTLSSTERQLQELNKKRAELEGRPEDVQRLTEVLLPRADGTVPPLTTPDAITDSYNDTTTTTTSNNTTSSSTEGVPRSVLSKILAKRNSDGSDDSPLTTQAVRDLQRAQKERVYSRVMVRVKFPDRSCLQGYFHPRHTIHDVYEWVDSSLNGEYSSSGTSSDWSFELYTSPPRTVLVPHTSTTTTTATNTVTSYTSTSTNNDGTTDIPTLSSLRLVPAALIYLAWKSNTKSGNSSGTSSDSSGTGSVEVGGCFRAELLVSDGSASGSSSGAYTFPTGTALAPPPATSSSSNAGSAKMSSIKSNDQSGAIGSGSSGEVKRSTKPKWFK